MIKINLANTLLKGADSGGLKTSSLGDPKTIKENALKVFLIIIPVIGMYFFEKHNLSVKSLNFNEMTLKKQKLDEELLKVGTVDDIVRQIESQKRELDDKVSVMKKIFLLRKQKLKTLVAIQTHIPRSTWIEKINFEDQEVTVTGLAATTEDAQVFASYLSQEKNLFASFSNKGVTSEKTSLGSELFRFEFKIKLKE